VLRAAAIVPAILLAALCGPGWAQEYHDCAVIILDASGSMASPMGPNNTQKMAAAKSALKEVLTSVPESTYIGLLVFSGKNVRDKWMFPLGPRNDQALTRGIDLPQPGGNTPLGQFIKIGADRLLEERAKQFGYGSYRLLIVTDGEATDGPLTDRYTPEVIARGITVDVIGVNMKQDHTLATQVHSYRRADDPQALKQALTEILAEVSTTGSDAVTRDAFDLLAPIPPELATAMVDALGRVNNKPVGVQASAADLPAPAGKAGTTTPGPPTPAAQKETEHIFLVIVIAAVVFLVIVARAARRRTR
jgi:hypothetical protein